MKKSRAIEVLKSLVNSFVDYANITMKEEDDNIVEALEMAVESLKAQLSQEGTTKDTISRQAAIDAAKDWYEGLICGSINGLIKRLNALPTIQPEKRTEERTETHGVCLDAISRQQAIELIKNYCENGCDIAEDNWCPSCQREQFIKLLKALPSAQPEPKEGEWIPHETPDGGVQYECSKCGVLWEFNDGTPEDNEAYFCPKCGAKLTTPTK